MIPWPLLLRIAPYVAAVAVFIGAVWYVHHRGYNECVRDNAAAAAKQTEVDRKLREGNDDKARSLDDDAALKCLRNPAGCR